MKVESNWFDELLKVTIYRDLLYRASIWTLFPLITLIINWRSNNYSAADYLMKAYASTMPALNFVFPVSTIMVLIALYTKHRESISSPKCQNVKKFYHTFRRFTSDVLIWLAGAFSRPGLLFNDLCCDKKRKDFSLYVTKIKQRMDCHCYLWCCNCSMVRLP